MENQSGQENLRVSVVPALLDVGFECGAGGAFGKSLVRGGLDVA